MSNARSRPELARPGNDLDALKHFYVPWSMLPFAVPPAGAKALCGTVRTGDDPVRYGRTDPHVCVVCLDLARGILG